MKKCKNPVKVGVIGLGKGRSHLDGFHQCNEVEVRAICDLDGSRLREEADKYPAVAAYEDYRRLLEDDMIDAVAVAVPNYLHAPVTLDCLRAGKHVLCEKPMALNAGEAVEMKSEAEKQDLVLMLHFNVRFMSSAVTLKPLTEQGKFGEIYHVSTTYTRYNGYPNPGSWFGQKARSGGGPLVDLGVHRLDLALWLMDYPEPSSVMGVTHDRLGGRKMAGKGLEFDCEDFSTALVRFENGASLYLAASWDGYQRRKSEITMNIYGTEGAAFERNGKLFFCQEGGEDEPMVEELELKTPEESPQQHFANAILTGSEPGPTAQQGLTVMRIVDGIYESARSGEPEIFR